MTKINTKKLTLTAMFLALGFVLPLFTGQIPQIGQMLLPMHIPIFLCAFICGWQYALPIGVLLPILRSIIVSRPNFYPEALSIAAELAIYGLVAGFIYYSSSHKGIKSVYTSLIASMIAGRVVRGIVQLALLGLKGYPFTFDMFLVGIVITGIPGIILQLVLIPVVVQFSKNKIGFTLK